jgi:hypothetical protein
METPIWSREYARMIARAAARKGWTRLELRAWLSSRTLDERSQERVLRSFAGFLGRQPKDLGSIGGEFERAT